MKPSTWYQQEQLGKRVGEENYCLPQEELNVLLLKWGRRVLLSACREGLLPKPSSGKAKSQKLG